MKCSMIMSSQEHDDMKMGHSAGKIEGYGNHSLASEAISISLILEKIVIPQIRLAFIKNEKKQKNRS